MIEKEKGNKEYKRVAGFSSYIYSFNVEKEPFTNAKVRKAFSLAVDRKFIVENCIKTMHKKQMHSFQKEQKHKVGVISVKKKVVTLNLIQQKRKNY